MTYPTPTLSIPCLVDNHQKYNPGAQAITNYDFASGTTGWTAVNSATLTVTAQILKIERNGVNAPGVKQTALTTGDQYWVEGIAVRSDGTWLPTVSLGGTVIYVGTLSTDWQIVKFSHIALGTDVQVDSDATGAGFIEVQYINIPVTAARSLDMIGSNHASLGDGATPSTMPTKLSDIGYRFDANTEYMRIVDPGVSSQVYWASCYLKPAAGGFASNRTYISMEDATNGIFRIFSVTSGRIGVYVGTVFLAGPTPAQANDNANQWIHYVWGQDGSQSFLYIDGNLYNTGVLATLVNSNQDFWIGQRYDQLQSMRADTCLIKYRNDAAITASEVTDLYQEDRRYLGRRFYI